eukprot:jgi/Tetstr1/427891/TSEL_017967.t1
MAHWAGRRDVPDGAYATNAQWPQPWQPWQRGAGSRRHRGTPTSRQLEEDVRRLDLEAEQVEATLRRRNDLFNSILKGDKSTFQSSLKWGVDVDVRAPGSGCTPLMIAASCSGMDTCSELLDAGANLHSRDNASGATAFIMAAFQGNVEVLHGLLQWAKDTERTTSKLLLETTKKGETALMAAAKAGHLEAVKLLLDAGAAIDGRASQEDHVTALHMACRKGRTEVVLELLARGALLEDPDDQGMRPLMHAAAGGGADCVRAMLSSSPAPDVEAADERGRTAALHAAAAGQVECLQVLHEMGAELSARTLAGSTGLLLACRRGHTAVVEWWLEDEARTADLHEQRGASGETPLHLAVRSGELPLVDRLLNRGAMLELQDA